MESAAGREREPRIPSHLAEFRWDQRRAEMVWRLTPVGREGSSTDVVEALIELSLAQIEGEADE